MSDPPGVEDLYTTLDLTIQLEEVQRKLAQTQRMNTLLLSRRQVIIKGKYDCDTGEEFNEESKESTTGEHQDHGASGDEDPAGESEDSTIEKSEQQVVSDEDASAKDTSDSTKEDIQENGLSGKENSAVNGKDTSKEDLQEKDLPGAENSAVDANDTVKENDDSTKGNLQEKNLSDKEKSAADVKDMGKENLEHHDDSGEAISAEDTDDSTKEQLQQYVKAMEVERETFLQTIGALEEKVQGLEKTVREMESEKERGECKIQAFETLFAAMNEQAQETSSLDKMEHEDEPPAAPASIGVVSKNEKKSADLPDTIETSEDTWSDCDSSLSTNLHHQRLEI